MTIKDLYDTDDLLTLEDCTLCPRECHVNRLRGEKGICGTDAGFNIASVCMHRGEEPPVSGTMGICNIFFEGCNLNCIYCQNHEISHPCGPGSHHGVDLEIILDQIEKIMSTGVNAVGFVTPSHVVPQVKSIIRGLNSRGLKPVTVYNTSTYDRVETLKSISGLIDVYLPDFKYVSPELAELYSGASDYPQVALKALKEMYYQMGSVLQLDENGIAERGMLIRHLILPGHTEESISVLETLAEELSSGVNLSLMSQYYPAYNTTGNHVLNRLLYKAEYEDVVYAMKKLGFRNGWVQDLASSSSYNPDFSKTLPFD